MEDPCRRSLPSGRYKCPECDLEFSSEARFNRHFRVHIGYSTKTKKLRSGLHACGNCLKTFKSKAKLNLHQATHNTARPHRCKQCDKSFKSKPALRMHLRVHSGYKPFKSNTCEASFAHFTGLKNHRRSHSGEKPYTCSLCDQKFSLRHHLKKHLTTVHKTMPKKVTKPGKTNVMADNSSEAAMKGTGETIHVELDQEQTTYIVDKLAKKNDAGLTDNANEAAMNGTGETNSEKNRGKPAQEQNTVKKQFKCGNCQKNFASEGKFKVKSGKAGTCEMYVPLADAVEKSNPAGNVDNLTS